MRYNLEKNDSIEEQFMWLVRFATVKQIKDFLTKNPSMDLHYPTPNLKTPLTSTIDRGNPQILSILLDTNSTTLDNTVTQPCGRTALMYASFVSRNPEILQVLLKEGADLRKVDVRGWTCLQYAIVGERSKNVAFLLEIGAFINQQDFQGRTPLMISVYLSNLDILTLLLDHGAAINIRDSRNLTALQIAILWRKRDAAILLIERGSDTGVVTPITKASIGELSKTSMPNILRCIEPKSRYAILGERSKNLAFLLEIGALINQQDFQGRTPLMTSVYLSNLDILTLLLDHGAAINIRGSRNLTALQTAILWQKRDAAILLIERGRIGELSKTTMLNILRCIEPKSRV